MSSLALFPDPARSLVQAVVTGLDVPASLVRVEPRGPVPVRGGGALTGAGAFVDDYECPLDVEVEYRLVDDTSGDVLASQTITLDGSVLGAVLVHPTDPGRLLPVRVVDDTPVEARTPGTVHHVIGLDLPLVTYTRRNDVRRLLRLWTPYAGLPAVWDATDDGSPMLLKVPAGCAAVHGWRWLERIRGTKRGEDPTGARGVDVEVEAVDVATPAGVVSSAPGNSWGAVRQNLDTWADVAASFDTWLDVRAALFPGWTP